MFSLLDMIRFFAVNFVIYFYVFLFYLIIFFALKRPKGLRAKCCFTFLLACRIKRCSFNVARGILLIASLYSFSALNKFFLPAKKCFCPNQRTSLPFSSIFFLAWIVRACTQYYPTNFQRMSCNFRNTKAGEKISFLFFRIASENFIEREAKRYSFNS